MEFHYLAAELGAYFAKLHAECLERLEKGELEYSGAWENMTIAQLKQERREELLDAMIYDLFITLKQEE